MRTLRFELAATQSGNITPPLRRRFALCRFKAGGRSLRPGPRFVQHRARGELTKRLTQPGDAFDITLCGHEAQTIGRFDRLPRAPRLYKTRLTPRSLSPHNHHHHRPSPAFVALSNVRPGDSITYHAHHHLWYPLRLAHHPEQGG